jgi:hypothetical protein
VLPIPPATVTTASARGRTVLRRGSSYTGLGLTARRASLFKGLSYLIGARDLGLERGRRDRSSNVIGVGVLSREDFSEAVIRKVRVGLPLLSSSVERRKAAATANAASVELWSTFAPERISRVVGSFDSAMTYAVSLRLTGAFSLISEYDAECGWLRLQRCREPRPLLLCRVSNNQQHVWVANNFHPNEVWSYR